MENWRHCARRIYSLRPLQELLRSSNRRYLEFLSHIDTPDAGVKALEKITTSCPENQHRYKGFNPLHLEDAALFRLLARGQFSIHGLTSRNLRRHLPQKTPGQISHMLKRLRIHDFLKKVDSTYKYYSWPTSRRCRMVDEPVRMSRGSLQAKTLRYSFSLYITRTGLGRFSAVRFGSG